MKRHLLIATVFLLAGAVVNVAVAWGCWASSEWWRAPQQPYTFTYARVMRTWDRYTNGRPWQLAGEIDRTVTVTDMVFTDWDPTLPRDSRRELRVSQAGFPMRSVARISFKRIAPVPLDEFSELIWLGFAVNTLVYAVVLWLLSGGPFRLRRFIRVKRALCPKCAYPMGESAVCSECGTALPERAGVAT